MSRRERAYPADFGEGVFHSACEFWSQIHLSPSIGREPTWGEPHSPSTRSLWCRICCMSASCATAEEPVFLRWACGSNRSTRVVEAAILRAGLEQLARHPRCRLPRAEIDVRVVRLGEAPSGDGDNRNS